MKRTVLLFFGLFLFLSYALADDYLGDFGTIVVTEEKPVWQIPAHVKIIGSEEIENSNAQTIADVLKANSGVVVSDYMGNSTKVNVDIAGFGETAALNVLVLVDGRRVNEIDLSGTDWLQIPVERVEKIEVIRGEQSTLYGDNASGGVINIITKSPAGKKLKFTSGYGSYGLRQRKFTAENVIRNFSYIVDGNIASADGYRNENFSGRQDLGLKMNFSAKMKLGFDLGFHKDNYDMPGGLWRENYENNRREGKTGDRAETKDIYIRTTGEKAILPWLKSQTAVSYRKKAFKTIYGVYSYEHEIPTLNFTEKLTFAKRIFQMNNTLTVGAEKFNSDFKQDSFENGAFTRNTATGKNAFGLSLNNELFLSDNLSFTTGARKESCKFDLETSTPAGPKTIDGRTDKIKTFSSGLSFRPNKKTNVYLSLSQGFRLPNIDEFKTFDPNTYAPTGITKDLKPQKSEELGAGIRKVFSEKVSGSLSVYSKEIKREIFYNPLTGANENYSSTKHQGLNIGLKIKPEGMFNLAMNYSFVKATLREDKTFVYYAPDDWVKAAPLNGIYKKGNDIPGVPKHKIGANISAGVTPALNLNLGLNYTGKRYFISDWNNEADKMPSFTVADLNLTFRKSFLKFFAGVNNIFNRRYSEYGTYSAHWDWSIFSFLGYDRYYYPSPERNFSAGVSLEF